jgi:ABC-2 type transport system ATP-binding protein
MNTKPLVVDKLTKSYGSISAVKSVSFEIEQDEIFALVGPNGAGKSTTLKIISTILGKTSGKVSVYGLDIEKDQNRIRKNISYLPEEAGAYKDMTGVDYLKFMAALYSDNSREQNEYFLFGNDISGLGDRLKDKIKTYSKGMTRKLLLARTVMTKPGLAILDEPTSGLDVINAFEIRSIIKKMSKNGMAVLLSSHNMLEIEFLSHRVGIINHGEIVTIGTPKELKNKYQAQNLEEVFISVTERRGDIV